MIIQNASSLFIGKTKVCFAVEYLRLKLDSYSDTSRHYCKVFSSLWPFWMDYPIRMIGGGACQKNSTFSTLVFKTRTQLEQSVTPYMLL